MGVKVPGLSKEQMKAILAEEMGEGSGEVESSNSAAAITVTPSTLPAAPPLDVNALLQGLAAAITQANSGTAAAIKDALSDATAMARAPIAETFLSGGYPGISVYSHPDGDAKTPRTKLHCRMYLGVYDTKGQSTSASEIIEASCTERERVLLNQLVAGEFLVERNDGRKAKWRVVDDRDDLGTLTRRTIAVPNAWLSKEEQAQMPGQVKFLEQMLAASAA